MSNTTSLPTGCAVCGAEKNLQRCAACKATQYCSRDHQVAHRETHKKACTQVRKAREVLQLEIAELNDYVDEDVSTIDPFTWPNRFNLDSRDMQEYAIIRQQFVEALLKLGNQEAVIQALEHSMRVLSKLRNDDLGLRLQVPAMLLRLGRDQECYDFMKWWSWFRNNLDLDVNDDNLPYLHIKNADAFESVADMSVGEDGRTGAGFGHRISTMLIKIRLLHDLMSLNIAASLVPTRIPAEIRDEILDYTLGPITSLRRDIRQRWDLSKEIQATKKEIRLLFIVTSYTNAFFWPALMNPGSHLTAQPKANTHTCDTLEDAQHMLQCQYDAWVETPGAIELIRAMLSRYGNTIQG